MAVQSVRRIALLGLLGFVVSRGARGRWTRRLAVLLSACAALLLLLRRRISSANAPSPGLKPRGPVLHPRCGGEEDACPEKQRCERANRLRRRLEDRILDRNEARTAALPQAGMAPDAVLQVLRGWAAKETRWCDGQQMVNAGGFEANEELRALGEPPPSGRNRRVTDA